MTNTNSATEPMYRPDDLMSRFDIKKDAYYARIKFLGIKPLRDSDKRVYLTEEQVKLLDSLHSHIENTGKMEGFNNNNYLVETNSNIVKSDSRSIDQATTQVEAINEQPHPDQFAALMRSGAEYAAGMEIAKYTIAAKFQENPNMLPDDLRQQVEEVKKQVSPKSQCPTLIADQFLREFKIA